MTKSGKYYAPPDGTLESFQEFISTQLPTNDLTEIFGMHGNADITSAINDTNELLGTVLSLMPRSAGAAGQSQEEFLNEKAKEILDKIPAEFDTYEAGKKHPINYNESMNTVLSQELLRFNKLINKVKLSLVNIGKAIKGEVVMNAELEEVGNAMFDNLVPASWGSVSYPSLKPLSSWVIDFIKRLEFI
jgi:dynein heavy chain